MNNKYWRNNMKKVLIALLALGSLSAFALEECRVDVTYNLETDKIEARLIQNDSYIAYLDTIKPCKEMFLNLTSNGELEIDVEARALKIQYIYSQSDLGSLSEEELRQVQRTATTRNARVEQKSKNIVFEKH
jgi:hypothetical protein